MKNPNPFGKKNNNITQTADVKLKKNQQQQQRLFFCLLITKAPNSEKSKVSEAELGEALGGQKN